MAKPEKKDPSKKPTTARVPDAPQTASEKESLVDSRFALPLDKDGNVLISTMRDESREKLRKILTDPAVAKALGVSGDETTTAGPVLAFPPMLLFPLVNVLSMAEMLVVARVTKAPRELVERVAGFTREEAQQLAPALGAVLSKYGSGLLTKYGDEIALAAMLSMMTMSKIAAVQEELAKLGPRGVVAPFVPPDRHDEPPASDAPESTT
jgi:hypothetical protein